MNQLKPPFGWVGGKSKLADEIISLFPSHRLYVEVFAGALNILYKKRPPQSSKQAEIVNDINVELINLHRVIKMNPQSLSAYLNELLISRNLFNNIRDGKLKPRNKLERAAFYYYLIAQSFGSKGDNFAMQAKTSRPRDIYRGFTIWSRRLKFVTVENMSFEKLISEYNQDDAFFYCDPPYFGTEDYYKNTGGFGIEEHIALRDSLVEAKGKFLVSYNDHPFIRDLYKDYRIKQSKEIDYTLGANVHERKKKVSEIYIMNYQEEGLFSFH